MGKTTAAGERISDEEMQQEVADQTANDLAVQSAFDNEMDGEKGDIGEAAEGT